MLLRPQPNRASRALLGLRFLVVAVGLLKLQQLTRQNAAQGRTVVATIHSPTASAFSLFDDLLMLRDGQLVYAGECGDAAADYFSKRVGLRPLEMGESMPE